MLEGIYTEGVLMHKESRPYPIHPQETSGLTYGSSAIFRYSLKETDYPNIIIPEPIYDGNGDVISPGYYGLALSDDRNYLILIVSKQARAIIPVFKIEEDVKEQQPLQDPDYQKELKKEAQEREKTNKKRAKVGMPPDEPYVHMDASIEYDEKGGYYLIKYERGTIKAWGAIKG